MKSWSLQLKFAIYSATLALTAVGTGAAVLLPYLYNKHITELDEQLKDNADELFRDLQNFKDAPKDPRKPVSYKFIPWPCACVTWNWKGRKDRRCIGQEILVK